MAPFSLRPQTRSFNRDSTIRCLGLHFSDCTVHLIEIFFKFQTRSFNTTSMLNRVVRVRTCQSGTCQFSFEGNLPEIWGTSQTNTFIKKIKKLSTVPCSRAKFPIVEKTQSPQIMQVNASTTTTIRVSFKMGPWNGL